MIFMAVLQTIRNFFVQTDAEEPEIITAAPPTDYEIRPLTDRHQKEVTALNLRCFKNGENYTKHTFRLFTRRRQYVELSRRNVPVANGRLCFRNVER
jgi:hypothetical protein